MSASVAAMNDGVCSVIVTWHPELAQFARLLDVLRPQVAHIVVVDNGTPGDAVASIAATRGAQVVRNASNLGLASALNRGLRTARAAGARHALLLDQDSLPAGDMVARLVAAWRRLSASCPVAAVGPRFVDLHSGAPAPFVRVGFPLNRKLEPRDDAPLEVDFLITSGTLLPLDVLGTIGGMDDALFIDNVDIDWCFRARRLGYRLFGVPDARMFHRIGDRTQRLPFGLGEVIVHSPLRLHYMMRNRVLLYRRRTTPKTWIAQDIPRLVLKFVGFALLVPPRARNARAMARGIWDGLRGRSGPVSP